VDCIVSGNIATLSDVCIYVIIQVVVVEEQVRATLKPFFKSGMIDKDAYKEIMRKAVPKVFRIIGYTSILFFCCLPFCCVALMCSMHHSSHTFYSVQQKSNPLKFL